MLRPCGHEVLPEESNQVNSCIPVRLRLHFCLCKLHLLYLSSERFESYLLVKSLLFPHVKEVWDLTLYCSLYFSTISAFIYEIKMNLQRAVADMSEAEFQAAYRSPLNYFLMMSECETVLLICAWDAPSPPRSFHMLCLFYSFFVSE